MLPGTCTLIGSLGAALTLIVHTEQIHNLACIVPFCAACPALATCLPDSSVLSSKGSCLDRGDPLGLQRQPLSGIRPPWSCFGSLGTSSPARLTPARRSPGAPLSVASDAPPAHAAASCQSWTVSGEGCDQLEGVDYIHEQGRRAPSHPGCRAGVSPAMPALRILAREALFRLL